jgi:Raf kinase inhibitor-like YbhB/YbcL family protein
MKGFYAMPPWECSLVARLTILMVGVGPCLCLGCKSASNDQEPGGAAVSLELTSTAFRPQDAIPKEYTDDGANRSPPLRWSEPPPGTKSLALICDDPDAPRGTWVHWVLFNLPAQARQLDEGVPTSEVLANGAKQRKNDFGKVGYGGPAPPRGKPHRYFFKLYALDTVLDLPAGATKAQVVDAMRGHLLAEGQLVGSYGR